MGRGSSYVKSNWDQTLSIARGLVKPVASRRTEVRHNAVRKAVRTQEESVVVELEEQIEEQIEELIEEQIEEQIEEPVLPPIEEAVVLASEEAPFFGPRSTYFHTVQNTFCY
jgi:hypothetical protein